MTGVSTNSNIGHFLKWVHIELTFKTYWFFPYVCEVDKLC